MDRLQDVEQELAFRKELLVKSASSDIAEYNSKYMSGDLNPNEGFIFLPYIVLVVDELSELNDISFRAMMGEYILYYQGKIIGGIYDDRFLVKPTNSAKSLMPDARLELPYEGAKEMLLVEDLDNREFLNELLNAMIDELPAPKKKKK